MYTVSRQDLEAHVNLQSPLRTAARISLHAWCRHDVQSRSAALYGEGSH